MLQHVVLVGLGQEGRPAWRINRRAAVHGCGLLSCAQVVRVYRGRLRYDFWLPYLAFLEVGRLPHSKGRYQSQKAFRARKADHEARTMIETVSLLLGIKEFQEL